MSAFSRTKELLSSVGTSRWGIGNDRAQAFSASHRGGGEERGEKGENSKYTVCFVGIGLALLAGTAAIATWRDWRDARERGSAANPVHTRPLSLYNFKDLVAFAQHDKLKLELLRSAELHEKHTAELQSQLATLSDTNLQLLAALKELELKLTESVAAREDAESRLSRVLSLLSLISIEGEEKPWMDKIAAALEVLQTR